MSKNKTDKKSKGMDFRIHDIETAVKHIESRLKADWCIMTFSNSQLIIQFEEHVYPPGTPKNSDFEMVGVLNPLCLCRKTNDLKEFCGNPGDFETVLAMEITRVDDGRIAVHTTGYYEGEKGTAMNVLMSNIRDILNSQ